MFLKRLVLPTEVPPQKMHCERRCANVERALRQFLHAVVVKLRDVSHLVNSERLTLENRNRLHRTSQVLRNHAEKVSTNSSLRRFDPSACALTFAANASMVSLSEVAIISERHSAYEQPVDCIRQRFVSEFSALRNA